MSGVIDGGVVQLGDRIEVSGLGPAGSESFVLLGDSETADPQQRTVVASSLLGRLLIGRRIGETVQFETAGGIVRMTILARCEPDPSAARRAVSEGPEDGATT